jgi:hypothetical protein
MAEQMDRWHARGSLLVTEPGYRPVIGQPPQYVGREFVQAVTRKGAGGVLEVLEPASHPAAKKPYELPAASRDKEIAKWAARLRKLAARDRSLWPADEATASRAGVEFVPLSFNDGEWIPKAPKRGKE